MLLPCPSLPRRGRVRDGIRIIHPRPHAHTTHARACARAHTHPPPPPHHYHHHNHAFYLQILLAQKLDKTKIQDYTVIILLLLLNYYTPYPQVLLAQKRDTTKFYALKVIDKRILISQNQVCELTSSSYRSFIVGECHTTLPNEFSSSTSPPSFKQQCELNGIDKRILISQSQMKALLE